MTLVWPCKCYSFKVQLCRRHSVS